ncbi:MAG: DNA topoisomerase IB [Candidatus Saccharibacteria bacterium]
MRDLSIRDGEGVVHDGALITRIEALAIPPAWTDVQIARSPRAKILALGYDSAGRQQAIYNPTFRARQEKLKFDRILRFAVALPKLRRQIARDLKRRRLGKEKVLACVVKLIDEAYFRVGNERYAEENDHYGITTMRSKHVDVHGDTVVFDFVGKSGKEHVKEVTDPQLATIIKHLDELPGYEIFRYQDEKGHMHDIDAADVNEYIKTYMGEEFSAKDFRTWGGTLLATTELLASEDVHSKTLRQKQVVEVVKRVAERLGNTPAVARSSYIDPRVIDAYGHPHQIAKVKRTMARMKPKRYLSRDEQVVLRILNA